MSFSQHGVYMQNFDIPTPPAPTAENLTRKQRTEAFFQSQQIPYLPTLPVIPDSTQIPMRNPRAVLFRAMCLMAVAFKGEGVPQENVDAMIYDMGLEPLLTPNEWTFIRDPDPEQITRVQFAWRYETAWVLFWALGHIEQLGRPDAICDVPLLSRLIQSKDIDTFLNEAQLRSTHEILDKADLYYRADWAVVSARLKKLPPPAGLDTGIVLERHYAFNWLISHRNAEWDDVRTDT